MIGTGVRFLRSRILGKALKNSEQQTERLSVGWGLPVLSSDAISSVAYAVQEILLVLVPVLAMASYGPLLGIAGTIIGLLIILVLCYRQVIDAYPQGGGAYSVAKHNLGKTFSLIAGASLIVDYVLTIAVSACAGTAAITSAVPALLPFKIVMTVVFVGLLTLGNLRGLRESSVMFGLPTYLFIGAILILIVAGLVKVVFFGEAPTVTAAESVVTTGEGLTMILLLRAFSSGCSALTGVEAVSNSVRNFKEPTQKHAKLTLLFLAVIVTVIFGGVTILTSLYGAIPNENITLIAQLAIGTFGDSSVMFYIIQVTTALILLLAANTAFNGLPQLLSLLAADRFVPARFGRRGTRLVFSNGILFAAIAAALLVVVNQGQEHALIPFYSVGVFLSFTIAQAGMVKHWLDANDKKTRHRAFVNGLGAVVTGSVCIVLVVGKFTQGAWAVPVVILVLVLLMREVRNHYESVDADLRIDDIALTEQLFGMVSTSSADEESTHALKHRLVPQKMRVIIPIASCNKAFLKAYRYAESLSTDIEVYHVSTSTPAARRFRKRYNAFALPSRLVIENTPYRNINDVLLEHIDTIEAGLHDDEMLTVVLPRIVTTRWWHYMLHNQTNFFLENALFERRDIAVVAIPYIVDSDLAKKNLKEMTNSRKEKSAASKSAHC